MSNIKDQDPINVLDLPQIYSKPSYVQLMGALDALRIPPPSWQKHSSRAQVGQDRNAAAAYLTQIISSHLSWLDSDDQRERLWDEASKRLAERSGRSAMPAMTRTWTIPPTSRAPELSLAVHEPPLTGDNLGLKTWASSYLLAKRLEDINLAYLGISHGSSSRALELGSGTGLVGLAAAAIWKVPVLLTDLPEIVPNLSLNARHNEQIIQSLGGAVTVETLDWNNVPEHLNGQKFQIILAADPLYSPEHAYMLARTINTFLDDSTKSHVVIELPLRDEATRAMGDELRTELSNYCLQLLHEGVESGFDDWEENGEVAEVKCWWGIWKRREQSTPSKV